MKRLLENLTLTILTFIFIFSCYSMINRLKETTQSNDVVKSLETIVAENKSILITEAETDSDSIYADEQIVLNEERMMRFSCFSDFKSINADFIGWIEIEGTKINYPVVQKLDDLDYYMKKDFYGKKSAHGSIYMASKRSHSISNNIILYGHHMKDGTMFASVNKYKDINYYKEHPIIFFDTEDGAHDYEVIGAFRFDANDTSQLEELLSADTKEKFSQFISYTKEHSYYETDASADYGDTLLTLMTCEYTYNNGRFFVVAKRIH